MRQMTVDEFNSELARLKANMVKAGLEPLLQTLDANILARGVCGLTNDTGCAYPGSLMVHINYTIALAERIAKMISATFPVGDEQICKCCVLQHIAKLYMFTANTNQWEIENRGIINKFNKLSARLKCGARGILEAARVGIMISDEEAEAILSMDNTEDSGKMYDNILTTIIRQANELAYAIEKEKYGNK
jgi:hypothetical protein